MEHEEKESTEEKGPEDTEEVEEQGGRAHFREDRPADEQADSSDSDDDDDSEVDEQKFLSDATLKYGIVPIDGAVATLR